MTDATQWERKLWDLAFGLLCLMPLLLATTRAGADIAMCIIAMLFLTGSYLAHNWSWIRQPEIALLTALWAFMLAVSWFTPIDPMTSFIGALIWGRFVLFFAAIRYWLLEKSEALKIVSLFGLAALLFVAIHAAWQYQGIGSQRLSIPFSHNLNVGHYTLKIGLPMLGMALYQILDNKRLQYLWIPLGGLPAMITLVMLSGERSAAVLMLTGMAILGIVLFYYHRALRKFVLLSVFFLLLLLAALGITQPVVQERTIFLVQQLSDFWNTPYGQLFIGSWRLWEQYPLTGIGIQQFKAACQPDLLQVTYCDVHPHNMYLTWLAEAGLPGIILMVAALALMLRGLLRESRFRGNAGVLAAFACAGFTVVVFPIIITQNPFSNWPAMTHWYSLGLILSLPRLAQSLPPRP